MPFFEYATSNRTLSWRQIYISCMYTDEADVDTDTHIVSVSISTRKKPAFSAEKSFFCSCFASLPMIFFGAAPVFRYQYACIIFSSEWSKKKNELLAAPSSVILLNRNKSAEGLKIFIKKFPKVFSMKALQELYISSYFSCNHNL